MIAGLSERIRRDARRIIGRRLLNTGMVTVSYQQPVIGSPALDPALEATVPDTTTVNEDHPALIHFVEASRSGYRQFTEIETGDAILDFLDDVVLPRTGATFIIDGDSYVQKEVGKELTQYWDLIVQGQRHFRTIVATKAPGSRPD